MGCHLQIAVALINRTCTLSLSEVEEEFASRSRNASIWDKFHEHFSKKLDRCTDMKKYCCTVKGSNFMEWLKIETKSLSLWQQSDVGVKTPLLNMSSFKSPFTQLITPCYHVINAYCVIVVLNLALHLANLQIICNTCKKCCLSQWFPKFSLELTTSNILLFREAQNINLHRDWRTTWANIAESLI